MFLSGREENERHTVLGKAGGSVTLAVINSNSVLKDVNNHFLLFKHF